MAIAEILKPPSFMEQFLEKPIEDDSLLPDTFFVLHFGEAHYAIIPHTIVIKKPFPEDNEIKKIYLLSCFENEEDCKAYGNRLYTKQERTPVKVTFSEALEIVDKIKGIEGLGLHENSSVVIKKVYRSRD